MKAFEETPALGHGVNGGFLAVEPWALEWIREGNALKRHPRRAAVEATADR